MLISQSLLEEVKEILGEKDVNQVNFGEFIITLINNNDIQFNTIITSIEDKLYLFPNVRFINSDLKMSSMLKFAIKLIFTNLKLDTCYPTQTQLYDGIMNSIKTAKTKSCAVMMFDGTPIKISDDDIKRLIDDNSELLKDIHISKDFDYFTVRIIIRFLRLGQKDIINIANSGIAGKELEVCGYAMCTGYNATNVKGLLNKIPKENYILARRVYKKAKKHDNPTQYFYDAMVNSVFEDYIKQEI